MTKRVWPALFEIGARGYDLLTDQRYWRRQILGLLDHAPRTEALRVLDLGCGPGVSSFVLAAALDERSEVVGIDLAHRMIERASAHRDEHGRLPARVRFEQADASALPFADASFDMAVGHSFLYLVGDPDAVLVEVRRVLRPGGRLVLMEPSAAGWLPRALVSVDPREALRHPWDAARFGVSMLLWRGASLSAGQLRAAAVQRQLEAAGFDPAEVLDTLAGLGLHCVGTAPR